MRRTSIAALAAGTISFVATLSFSLLPRSAHLRADDEPAATNATAAQSDPSNSSTATLRHGAMLVAESDAGPWRWLARGDSIPTPCMLRVPENAPASLDWQGAQLTASEGARLEHQSDRSLVLSSGRVYFDASPDATPRTLRAADVSIAVPTGAAIEITLDDANTVRAIATRAPSAGQPAIQATAPGLTEATDIAPGFAFGYGTTKETRTYLPLEAPQKETDRIAAWTAAGQPTVGLGQLVVNDPQSGRSERLNIARSHVNVVLAPPVALVQLDQSFYNPQSQTREGTFVFNLPRGASVSRFAMYVDASNLIEGELIDRRRAAEVYDRIVSGRRDPAILEQLGDNLFRMRVFPIPGRDIKRILLDFTLPLAAVDGRCRFELPLLSDLEPIWDFRITGSIRGVARPESALCRSLPEMSFAAAAEDSLRFEFARQNFQPTAPLDIEFPLAESREPTVRSYAAQALPPRAQRQASIEQPQARAVLAQAPPGLSDNGRRNNGDELTAPDPFAPENADPADAWRDHWAGRRANYFLATLPSLDQQAEGSDPSAAPAPADVLILADTSGATAPQESVRQAVRTVVRNLRPGDRFRLACADVALRPLGDEWIAPETPAAREVLARFEQQVFLGASDLSEVLQTAAGLIAQAPAVPEQENNKAAAARRRLVVYVGDGVDTKSEITSRELAGKVSERLNKAGARFVAALVRDDARGFEHLDLVARQTGGMVLSAPGGSSDGQGLLRWMLTGLPSPRRIVSLVVSQADESDVFAPAAWPEGRGLPIFGRLSAEVRELEITLLTERDGRQRTDTFKLPLPGDGDDLFIGRLWAQERLNLLRHRQATQQFVNRWLDQEMLGLSQQWTLLSPLTAFLVLETEKDYARWNIDRRQRRRYWQPAEAIAAAPLPADWIARVRPAAKPDPLADPAEITRALVLARQLLADGQTRRAMYELEHIRNSPLVPKLPEYAELVELAQRAALREAALELLGPSRVLVDRGADVYRERPELQLARPTAGHFPAEFLERHPHAVQLLQEVSFPSAEITLTQLVRLLSDLTKTNVDLDVAALDGAGTAPDTPLAFSGFGKFALRDFVQNLLMPEDLVLVDEHDQLIITTTEEAQNRMQTEVYPVADLLLSDRVASFDQLVDPYADHQMASEARIRQRLLAPIPVDFTETPLTDVAWAFAQQLDIPVVLDIAALDGAGTASDTPITIHRQAMPARDALRWFLQEHDLTYVLHSGALLITTTEEAQNLLHTRLHSGIGLLAEYPLSNIKPGDPGNRFMGQGMFGGMSGGMGGMGGGMGGLGGMMGGAPAAPPSTGGNLQLGGTEGDQIAEPEPKADAPTGESPPARGSAGAGSVLVPPGQADESLPLVRYFVDAESLIDLITSTIQPTHWEEVGGSGVIEFHRPTLDLVVSGTEDIHDHIESLFAKLRKLPPVGEGRFGMRLAQPRPLTEDADQLIDFDSLIDLIASSVAMTTWEDVGGKGAIESERPRLALVISQTEDVHAEISNLLMLLRRSRFEQVFGTRPWESAVGSGGVLVSGWLLDSRDAGRRAEELPAPQPEELAALAIRRELATGNWTWRRTLVEAPVDENPAEQFSLAAAGGRLQLKQSDRSVLVDGDDAAVAYPSFDLVELGTWGQAARETIDGWLPWLPHRTNEELARRFEITVVPPPPDLRPNQAEADRKRKLRFAFPGQTASIYLEATFSEMHGLPIAWEAHVDGQLTQRLRFADFKPTEAGPQWHQVTLEDATGKPLARWELVASEIKIAVPKLSSPLDNDSFLGSLARLDRRPTARPRDTDLNAAIAALERRQWNVALAALDALLAATPDRPLPLYLKAWCHEQQGQPLTRDALIAALSRVAASPAVDLTRLIAAGTPGFLSAAERYAILLQQPEDIRSHDDWAHLAHWAVEAGKRDEALAHVDRSLEPDEVAASYRFARQLLRTEILLSLDRGDAIGEVVTAFVANRQATPDEMAQLAGMLARFGRRDDAERLLTAALGREGLADENRYGLLVARAACQVGLARWRTLLEAELLLPAGAPQRGAALANVLGELHQPIDAEIAAQLAAGFAQPRVHWPLVIRQAELTVDAASAAELWWHVYEAGQLPDDKLYVACARLNDGRQSERAVEIVERQIRQRATGMSSLLTVLERAYRTLGRADDARRAATNETELAIERRWQETAGNQGTRR